MKHNFGSFLKQLSPVITVKEPEDLHIVRCCDSCKHYIRQNATNGFCKFNAPKLTKKQDYLLPRVASATVCSDHRFVQGTLRRIELWFNKKINRMTLEIIKNDDN